MDLRKESTIKNSTIFIISLVITVFINLKRGITLFIPNQIENIEFTNVTPLDMVFRVVSILLLNVTLLHFNIHWKYDYLLIKNKYLDPLKNIVINLLIAIIFLYGFLISYETFFKIDFIDKEIYTLYFGWSIILISNLLTVQVLDLQLKNKINIIEKEQLIQDKLANELDALKNQVNPHFLFNSLNTLNGVIRKNPELATNYVDELSFMYRYILQSGHKGLVSLREEMDFLNSYIYLVQIRYGKNLVIHQEISEEAKESVLPVLALQLIVENAIKHNEISSLQPLTIHINTNENHEVIISNKIAPRKSLNDSTGHGLANLSQRYHLLMDMDITIHKNDTFTVHLPISIKSIA